MGAPVIYHGASGCRGSWPIVPGAITGDHLVIVTGTDTTAGTLQHSTAAGTGIALNVLVPGGDEVLQIVNTAPETYTVIAALGDLIPGTLSDKIEAGFCMGKETVWGTGIAYTSLRTKSRWWSDFSVTAPLLDNSPCVKTGHWVFGAGSYDVTTGAGIADSFRWGVNGDFDYIFRVKSLAGVGYIGMRFPNRGIANPFYVRVYNTGTVGAWNLPGALEITTATGLAIGSLEILARYRDGGYYGFYRNTSGSWIPLNDGGAPTAGFFGNESSVYGEAQLIASVNGKIDKLYFADNGNGAEDNPYHSQIIYLADGANITPVNYQGNTFEVTLAGNRTLANPSDNIPGQTILIRVRQDGTGGRTLTYGAKYRFRFDNTPLLSRIAGAVDVLRFVYDPVDDKWDYDQIVPANQVVALTDAATIAVDARKGSLMYVTLTASRTLGNPTNPTAGQKIMIRVIQGGSGSYTLAYDTKYRFSTDLPSPTLSTAVGKIDYLGFIYNEVSDKWDFVGKVFGF